MLGYARGELVGMSIASLTPEDDWERQQALMQPALVGSAPGYRMDKSYRHKDGHTISTIVNGSVVRDDRGAPLFWITQVEDVTEQRRLEEDRARSERLYRSLAENLPGGAVFIFDRDLVATLVEGPALASIGIAKDRMLGKSLAEAPSAIHEQLLPLVRGAIEGESSIIQIETGDLILDVHAVPLCDQDGTVFAGLMVASDVTDRHRIEEITRQTNEGLRVMVQELERRTSEAASLSEMGDLLAACANSDEANLVLVRLLPRLFPTGAGAIYVTKSSRNLVESIAEWGGLPPDESTFSPDECWALRRGRVHSVTDAEHDIMCHHVTVIPDTTYVCAPMMAQGEALGVLHLRVLTDGQIDPNAALRRTQLAASVAEHIGLSLANFRLRETLHAQSIRDALTGLFNRRFMEESLDRELHRAKRTGRSVSVLMIDVDGLKAFNDTMGHEAGDRLIRATGRYLADAVRSEDIVCRYGGDEFTLIFPETDPDEARSRAEALCRGFDEVDAGAGTLRPSLSIGIACSADRGSDPATLVGAADEALYRAKGAGRNRVAV
jgi:diguanylate cyclase (GGDEF)-like protein/PAS domain S-box-containing protein